MRKQTILIVITLLLFSSFLYSQKPIVNLNRLNRYDGKNRKVGVWISTTPKNCNVIIQRYRKGVRNGFFKMYFSDGSLAKEGVFKNDKEHGKWSYFINGIIVSQTFYKNGIFVKSAIFNPRQLEKIFE